MAHELSIRANGKAEMAFIGGETPWHGLGQSVTKGASIGVWMKEAGMDWEAKESPVFYEHEVSRDVVQGPINKLDLVDSHKVIYRGDTGAPLGVVGSRYNIVQPRDVLEFFRTMTEEGGWHIHTAGVLRGGRKLWAMATNGQVERIGGGRKKGASATSDEVINQLLFATSLDGSMKTIVKECATVVVCANTMARAMREGGRGVVVSHRSVFDADAVKRSLGLAQLAFDKFMRDARVMAEVPIRLDEALSVLNGIFGKPKEAKQPAVQTAWMGDLSDMVAEQEGPDEGTARASGRVLELFSGAGLGAALAGRAGTRWGLFNAVTQYVDHEAGRTQDTRMESAWFGRGDTLKQAAYEALAEAA